MTRHFKITALRARTCWKRLPAHILDHPQKQTPRSFATFMRMQLALYMLTGQKMNATEVANMLGLGNARIFTKVFKHIYFFPPSMAFKHLKK